MDKVKLQPRVVLRPPTFRTLEAIRTLEKSRLGTGQGLGGVYGFVDPHFAFVHNHQKDWKPVPSLPGQWQFVGASLTLEVRPEVFLPAEFKTYPAVLAPIQKHEQEHVVDARDIVTRTLPAELVKDQTFQDYFLNRKPIPFGTYRHMLPTRVAGIVAAIFAGLWNTAVAKRDTPARYKPVQEAVSAAMRKLHP